MKTVQTLWRLLGEDRMSGKDIFAIIIIILFISNQLIHLISLH